MSWINIKDYQFEKDTYMNAAKVDEEIPSLNQHNIEKFSFEFQNTVVDDVLLREYGQKSC